MNTKEQNRAEKYLNEIGLDEAWIPEIFNNDDKSYYKVSELMQSYSDQENESNKKSIDDLTTENQRIKRENEKLRKSLEESLSGLHTAVATIRAHNGMGMNDRLEDMSWKAYQHSPEMKLINKSIKSAEESILEQTTEWK